MLVTGRFNDVSREILGGAIEVHRHLGPGLLESIYVRCLLRELQARKLSYITEHLIPVVYKSEQIPGHYRVDLLVEGLVIVEAKALDHLPRVHESQLLTYLRLTGCPAGLLINFNVPKLMDGVTRLLNTTPGVTAAP